MLVVIEKGGRKKTFQNVSSFWTKIDKNEVSLKVSGDKELYIYTLTDTSIKMWHDNIPNGEPDYQYPTPMNEAALTGE